MTSFAPVSRSETLPPQPSHRPALRLLPPPRGPSHQAAMASTVDAIRVGIRARPFGKQKGQKRAWDTNEKSLVCTGAGKKKDAAARKAPKGKQMDFDHVR